MVVASSSASTSPRDDCADMIPPWEAPPPRSHKLWIAINKDAALASATTLQICARLGYAVGSHPNLGVFDELFVVDYKSADGEVYPSVAWHGVIILHGKRAGVAKFLRDSREGLSKAPTGVCTLVAVRKQDKIAIHFEDGDGEPYCPRDDEELVAVAIHAPEEAMDKKASNKLSLFNGGVGENALASTSAPPAGVSGAKKDSLLLAGFCTPGRAANVAGHLGIALAADRRRREEQEDSPRSVVQSWEPEIIITEGGELAAQFRTRKAAGENAVAFVQPMEAGGAVVQLQATKAMSSRDMVFDGVAF